MKRAFALVLLATLVLSACAPVSAPTSTPATPVALLPTDTPALTATPTSTPTATPTPTSTSKPTPTPTVTPTATPTPIPTLSPEQVGGLTGVPDPRYSNPELFDLSNPDAPIPQFVNAMKMARVEISAEEVVHGVIYRQLKGKDDPFVIALVYIRPEIFGAGFEDLGGNYPLFGARRDQQQRWIWQQISLGELAAEKGVVIRLAYNFLMLNSGNPQYDQMASLFNGYTLPDGHWYIPYSPRNSIRPDRDTFNFRTFDRNLGFLSSRGINSILFQHLIWGYEPVLPSWLLEGKFTSDELKAIAAGHIEGVMTHFRGQISKYVVVNFSFR